MDYNSLLPLARAVAKAGFPVLAEILGTVVPFPGNLVAKTILNGISAALGTDPDNPAEAAAKIEAANGPGGDPNGETNAKLSAIEVKAKSDWDMAKLQVDQNLEALKQSSTDFTVGGLFLNGWRPAFAWTVVLAVIWQLFGSVWWHVRMIPPDTFNPVWTAFYGMLGLGTVEKLFKVAPAIDKVKIIPEVVKKVFKGKRR